MRAFFHSPYVCLLLVIGLLASVTPVMKAVFTKDQVDPIMVAALRTIIPFAVLFPIAACRNRVVLMSLRRRDLKELSALGVLGIGSYLVAATGLSYTTVTHYVLIYSLLPGCTAILMAVLKHRRLTTLTIIRDCAVVYWLCRCGHNQRGTGNRVGGGGGRCARAALYGDVGVASRGEPSDYEACGDAHRAYRDVWQYLVGDDRRSLVGHETRPLDPVTFDMDCPQLHWAGHCGGVPVACARAEDVAPDNGGFVS